MNNRLKVALNSATFLTGCMLTTGAMAQDAGASSGSEEIVVTATRRETTLQDTPINISAISADMLEKQRIDDVRDIADFTPGITISDTGPTSTGSIVLRGISADDTGDSGSDGDNTLGIYLGEVPLYYDFKLLDLERVETLLGPQGTLYGVGTLAGAIRYIPKRPNPDSFEAEVHSRVYGKDHSKDVGFQGDFMLNIPLVRDHVAFRTASGYYFDPGFIDYPLVLREPGVSLPQAGGTGNAIGPDYAANLRMVRDVNFERTYTTRNQLLLQYNPNVKAILTYVYQQTRTNGRQANSAGVLGTGPYENGSRYVEPHRRHAHLVSLELNANLWDIADLVATTAYTNRKVREVKDQTDQLLDLELGYEAFPAFSAYLIRDNNTEQYNDEIRLVSRHGGPFSWTIGGFYNKQTSSYPYVEIAPGLADFYGVGDTNPDDIEYASITRGKVTEKAAFGELTYQVTPAWQVTAGARYFKYSSRLAGAIVLPLLGDPLDPDELPQEGGTAGKSGWVWKFNSSYKIAPDLMVYATYSKGYRLGGPNYVAPCPDPVPPDQQNACALPDELQYGPDTTKNIEIGLRGELFDRKLNFHFDVFRINWSGLQLGTETTYGAVGITGNGGSARSQGFEASFTARPTRGLSIQGTYSYVDAKLTSDAPGIISIRTVPGDYSSPVVALDALAGDRLPGSAKNAGSLGVTYTRPLGDAELIANWTAVYRGNVVSRLGWERTYGELIPSYVTHRASLTYSTEKYDLSLWANNIFDKYAVVSIGADRSRIGVNDGFAVRYYSRAVINPRTFGIEGRFKF
ncbi:TonB-dependent receptor [Sphingopyxis macrogoltabida]|uniref:TonB-dependent receptor n=1 Tax=Sphingopyxis macrogoltabida TaxID=33050 RepID=A0AAC8YY56_SPHMC|nr:TonB-dependent receptor [Sphingopyxis macrogoltabida]ALJ12126.1 TonB-dependent receptor [Sphingopyxis macrogoltabida]AMU88302.1 TonB-dependent receptor [Sphingopyxis macrogoltabida]